MARKNREISPALLKKAKAHNEKKVSVNRYPFEFKIYEVDNFHTDGSPTPETPINNADQKFVEALKLPALSCGINYYRASFQFPMRAKQRKLKVKCPTLVIWGEQDNALGKELTYSFPEIVEGPYTIKYIPSAGHWVQQEEPELVNKYILEFLGVNF